VLKTNIGALLFILAAFALAGTVAPSKAKAVPIETSNSPIFKQDWTATVGVDNNFGKELTIDSNRLFGAQPAKLTVDQRTAEFLNPTKTDQYYDTRSDQYVKHVASGVFQRGDGFTVNAANVVQLCSGGTTRAVGSNCNTRSKQAAVSSFTAYGQGAVRTGGNTAIFAGYNGDGKTVYGGAAVALGQLALTGGADKYGARYSAAYSIGSFSPFYLKQNNLDHYGLDYRLNDNLSVNAAYRSDKTYVAGLGFDVGSSNAPAVALAPVQVVKAATTACAPGWLKQGETCIAPMPPPPVREIEPLPAPPTRKTLQVNPRGVRGRG
jgi:hypothetical protein